MFRCVHGGAERQKRTETPVNRMRAVVLDRCRGAAEQAPGLFSLTVPTGGGKTLASLAFALRHARHHGKRRIFYVIPYTSIIEQTADVFRDVFGEDAVLEHHSNLDSDRETPRSRLACENWEASLVVTTNVQFFESLFAARPSRTRKLHNTLDSVVILDEAQLLPPDFLTPILGAIRELSRHYGVSFVLCTATQPALASRRSFDFAFDGLDEVREIVGDATAVRELHKQLRRVEVALPEDLHAPTSWEAVAAELETHPRALCIVDRRDDARILHGLLPAGTVHLSGLMCGQHRAEVIAAIKRRLNAGEPIPSGQHATGRSRRGFGFPGRVPGAGGAGFHRAGGRDVAIVKGACSIWDGSWCSRRPPSRPRAICAKPAMRAGNCCCAARPIRSRPNCLPNTSKVCTGARARKGSTVRASPRC
ncbi:MAG: DEAD/DEAH box helicase [Candidatus Competibacter sp.]